MAPGVSLDKNGPVCCAAVESLMHKRHHDQHRQKISRAKTSVNNTWDPDKEALMKAMKHNVRRRDDNIERENMRLLLRFQEIDARRGPGTSSSSKAAAQAIIDPGRGVGSNAPARLQELRRIDDENRRIMKRLASTKPSADVRVHKLENGFRNQQKVMRMRCEHGQRSASVPRLRRHAQVDAADEECARLLRVEAMHREGSYLDLPESADAELSEGERDDGSQISPMSLLPRNGAMQGGALPNHSRQITEALMAKYQKPDISDGLDNEMEAELRAAEQQAEEAFRFKKALEVHIGSVQASNVDELAEERLRMARAIDVEVPPEPEPSAGMLSYGDVVQRAEAILGRQPVSQRAS